MLFAHPFMQRKCVHLVKLTVSYIDFKNHIRKTHGRGYTILITGIFSRQCHKLSVIKEWAYKF